jgi:hypothetical protein
VVSKYLYILLLKKCSSVVIKQNNDTTEDALVAIYRYPTIGSHNQLGFNGLSSHLAPGNLAEISGVIPG